MRIVEISFSGHKILGNLHLDFLREDETPYDTVLLVGENGTGKTTILNTIANMANCVIEPGVKIKCQLDHLDCNVIREFQKTQTNIQVEPAHPELSDTQIKELYHNIILSYHSDGAIAIKYSDSIMSRELTYYHNMQNNPNPLVKVMQMMTMRFKANKATPDFQQVSSTTNLDIDNRENEAPLSRNVVYANSLNCNELLVDINAQDANEIQSKVYNDEPHTKEDAENRVKRFRTAFNSFFDGLEFVGVRNMYDVQFKKDDKTFTSNNLSSGESTIVQNGVFFLKDKNIDEPFIALIDEPEQALHPKWEDKILQFYKNILTNDENDQLAQLFITTHSEYVLRDAMEANDLIIVLQRNIGSSIEAKSIKQIDLLPCQPTYNMIKYVAFNLITTDLHNELFSILHQNIQDANLVKNGKIESMDNFLHEDTTCPPIPSNYHNARLDQTLPVYIRNYIDHPLDKDDKGVLNRTKPSEQNLKTSITYMINKIKNLN